MARTIGIDLGTTMSEVAGSSTATEKFLDNREGSKLHALGSGDYENRRTSGRRFGQAPANYQPGRTHCIRFKRFIGRRFSDSEVQRDKKLLPYEIRERARMGSRS